MINIVFRVALAVALLFFACLPTQPWWTPIVAGLIAGLLIPNSLLPSARRRR